MRFLSIFWIFNIHLILNIDRSAGEAQNKITKQNEFQEEYKEFSIKDLLSLRNEIQELKTMIKELRNLSSDRKCDKQCAHAYTPLDCSDILQRDPNARSGVYKVNVGTDDLEKRVLVFCDMSTDGGGWTMIQRRIDGSLSFYRDYISYAEGFGDVTHEFYLGNENLFLMTSRRNYQLRIDLESFEGQSGHALYTTFKVDSSCDGFRLHVTGYTGMTGDALSAHNNARFSTFDLDQENDVTGNCAYEKHGGWWYRSSLCGYSNLNGHYLPAGTNGRTTIHWWNWFKNQTALKYVDMKIRPGHLACPIK